MPQLNFLKPTEKNIKKYLYTQIAANCTEHQFVRVRTKRGLNDNPILAQVNILRQLVIVDNGGIFHPFVSNCSQREKDDYNDQDEIEDI